MSDGSLIFDTKIDSNGFEKGIKNINSGVESAKKSINTLKSTAFSLITTFGFAFSINQLNEYSASVNALNSQFEQTFGNLQKQAENAMQEVAKQSGIVETRLQSVGTSIYAFAKTTGMDSVSALNMMQDALQVTADSAAYYDRSLEDTAESLKSFLKGNFENDAALGLSCTETTRNAMANKLYGKSFVELSESQKQLALLEMVKEANQLSGAMGQASREADGWENVTGNLKEQWKQLLAVLGQPVLQITISGIKNLTSILQNLTSYAKSAFTAFSDVFGRQNNSDNSIEQISASAESATDNLTETTEQVKELKNSLAGFDELNVLSSTDDIASENTETTPVTLNTDVQTSQSEQAVNRLTSLFEKLKKSIEPVKKALDRLSEALKPLKDFSSKALEGFYQYFLKPLGKWTLGEGFPKFVDIISKTLENIDWDKLQASLDNFWQSLEPFTENVGEGLLWFLSEVLSPLASWAIGDVLPEFLDIFSAGLDVLNAVIDNFKEPFGWLWDSFLSPIAEWTGGVIVDVLNGIGNALEWIAGNELAITILSSLAIAIGVVAGAIQLISIAFTIASTAGAIFNAVMTPEILIFGAIVLGITAIIAAIWLLVKNWDKVKIFFVELGKNLTKFWQDVGKFWIGIFKNVWEGIKDTFGNVVSWFRNTFTKAWQAVRDVFSKGGEVFVGIKDGILSGLKSVINGLIEGINWVIEQPFNGLNRAMDTLRNISIFGNTPFEWLPSFDVPKIPKLATGTVVPASYGEYLAVLGDNKREPEVVSPLSTMKQALAEVLSEVGLNSSGDIILTINLDGDAVFKSVVKRAEQQRKRTGKPVFSN